MFKLEVNSLEELPKAASKFIDAFNGKKIFLFDAQMGAGKTTFIKELELMAVRLKQVVV